MHGYCKSFFTFSNDKSDADASGSVPVDTKVACVGDGLGGCAGAGIAACVGAGIGAYADAAADCNVACVGAGIGA